MFCADEKDAAQLHCNTSEKMEGRGESERVEGVRERERDGEGEGGERSYFELKAVHCVRLSDLGAV